MASAQVDMIESVEDRRKEEDGPGPGSGSVSPVEKQRGGDDVRAVALEIDAATERRVRRKFDRVVVPLVFALYLVAFLDRSNIGNANLAGMSKDLGLDDSQYQWLLTIFYIPYILFEWCAIMWKVVPPHIWACVTVFTWGLASTLQSVAFNFQGMMAARWFLAMAEAGFGPGVPYLLSFFYRRHEIGFRCGIFLSAAPLATTFAGALAYGITSGQNLPIASWRLLFLIEGLPCFVLAAVVFFYLPDSPDTATFLTPEEKGIVKARSMLQSGKEGKDRLGGIAFKDVLATLRTPQTWIMPLMYFSCNVSFASLPVFLPVILNAMGYGYIDSQGLTAPPYFLAFLVCIGTTWVADRTQQRGLMIAGLSVIGGVGYLLLATVHSVNVRYMGVFLAAAGVFPAIANILSWVVNNQGTDTKRGVAIALLNIVGQCGPLLGTHIFPAAQKPYYVRGMAVCAAFMFFNAVLALLLRVLLVWENRRLEAQERAAAPGLGEDGKGAAAVEGTEMEGTVGYRYIL